MKKITICFLIGFLIAALSLTACGSTAVKETGKNSKASVQSENEQTLQYGQIKSIKDNKITLALGTANPTEPPQGKKEQAPDGQTPSAVQAPSDGQNPSDGENPPGKPDDQNAPGGQPPEKPDGQNPPDGQIPPADEKAAPSEKSNITLTDETLTININDSTKIGYMKNSTSSAAISDLSVGTTIAVSLSDDGKTAKQILIIK
ncbi:hypothetical protein [Aminipila terrae]|uniref:DUF5666 domain-containing protein n=1 Tax=Aminipila terrae TaxID=2697030 RepID=A0A6P1MDH3_9FIRM|nr:hypothetical protein [Aminipila terrae]QHI72729.1 hypothetical protein Ami3637_10240 [Aminipila terrae]